MLLDVKGLKTYYFTDGEAVKAVDNVSFSLERGQVLGIVGESGCGKSTVAFSLMRLLSYPGRIIGGEVWFDNGKLRKDITKMSEREMRELRGKHISMVFQDPMTYLNPVMRVGDQIAESISFHFGINKGQALKRTKDILGTVGIPSPSSVMRYYPHRLSGGMRQRVLISMAVSCEPDLLIADEPTTALDVTIQAQIIQLLKTLKDELGVGLLLITHDLGVVADICDRVCVMYAGEIVEEGEVGDIYNNPLHPYTQALLGTTLSIEEYRKDIVSISGVVPNLVQPPAGCRFHPRCPYAFEKCMKEHPLAKSVGGGRVACWLHQ